MIRVESTHYLVDGTQRDMQGISHFFPSIACTESHVPGTEEHVGSIDQHISHGVIVASSLLKVKSALIHPR